MALVEMRGVHRARVAGMAAAVGVGRNCNRALSSSRRAPSKALEQLLALAIMAIKACAVCAVWGGILQVGGGGAAAGLSEHGVNRQAVCSNAGPCGVQSCWLALAGNGAWAGAVCGA